MEHITVRILLLSVERLVKGHTKSTDPVRLRQETVVKVLCLIPSGTAAGLGARCSMTPGLIAFSLPHPALAIHRNSRACARFPKDRDANGLA
jgi:hypothetical protein